jgi:phosphoglycerate dehydrogenase-like enzyme
MMYQSLSDSELSLVVHEVTRDKPGKDVEKERCILEELVRRFDYLIASLPATDRTQASEIKSQLELF